MEDDDGLLLNFSTAEVSAPAPQRSKITGGRWKDRRRAQLLSQGRDKKPTSDSNAIEVDNSVFEQRKKNVESTNSKPKRGNNANNNYGPSSKRIRFTESNGEFGGKNNSYVSSLFTSNQQSSTLKESSQSENTTYLPSNAPLKDATTFDGLGLNDKLTKHLTDTLRFKAPTKVQRSVVPNLLSTENDLFVKAQTGSGKTLAFLLPIMHKLMSENTSKITRDSGLFGIILTPTRELATQIYGVMETLVRCHHHIVPGIVIGGEKKKSEKARLRKGVNILVATPGRLADHMENTSSFDVSQLRWLILDEGDRLVELGFEETITKITNNITRESKVMETMHKWQGLPNKRVNVLCSATIQDDVKKLGSIVLNNPEMISVNSGALPGTTSFDNEIGDRNEDSSHNNATAPDQLVQRVVVVPPKLRLVTLGGILKKISKDNDNLKDGSTTRTIVFFSCSDSVEYHFDVMTRNGKKFKKMKDSETDKIQYIEVPHNQDDDSEDAEGTVNPSMLTTPMIGDNTVTYKLHGSLSQQVRTSTLLAFIKNDGINSSKHAILFCTDVASRGLDLPNISNVVEFDPPFSVEDHLHRIGRSARLGQTGFATLFLLPGPEEGYVEGKIESVHPKKGNLRIVKYENFLKEGFAEEESDEGKKEKKNGKPDPKQKQGKWDIHATTWHLDVERWLLEDTSAHDKAVQAFTSHIRAYATHLSSERQFFNVKLLHFGHLAKSFGLRETPKKLGKTIGTNINKESTGKTKVKKEDPKKKMMRMARMAVKSTTDEFNY